MLKIVYGTSNKILLKVNMKKNSDQCVIKNLELGLCCINSTLRSQTPSVYPNRTCRLATAEKKGLDYVKSMSLRNLEDVLVILEWNKDHGIMSYRMSSDMFPHASNPRFGDSPYDLDFAKDLLRQIGRKAFEYGIRLSFHPGQFNQVGSPRKNVFENTVRDLDFQAMVLDIVEEGIPVGENMAIMCIHGGGVYGDKEQTINRWVKQFGELPERVRRRIALENCERCYSVKDCLRICNDLDIPLIMDTHHFSCYNIIPDNSKIEMTPGLMSSIIKTWTSRGLKPYFHISEQGSGRLGHHSDYVESIPQYLLDINIRATLDVEAKAKEKAILHLVDVYSKKNKSVCEKRLLSLYVNRRSFDSISV